MCLPRFLVRQQQKAPSEHGDEGEEQNEIRNNSPDALGVEGAVVERLALQTAEDNAGNENAEDDEEKMSMLKKPP